VLPFEDRFNAIEFLIRLQKVKGTYHGKCFGIFAHLFASRIDKQAHIRMLLDIWVVSRGVTAFTDVITPTTLTAVQQHVNSAGWVRLGADASEG
jgi:hypothetical protein